MNQCDNIPTLKQLQDVATNSDVLNESVTSDQDLTPTTATDGEQKKTLAYFERQYNEAIQATGGVPLGTWAAGMTYNAYNEYLVYNGVPYKPATSTTLPYTTQGSDPTVAPDVGNVVPFVDGAHNNLVGRGEQGAHPASAIDMGGGNSLEDLSDPNSSVLVGGEEASILALKSNFVIPEMFGAKGDYNPSTGAGTDDHQAFQDMFNFALTNLLPIKIPTKNYLISEAVVIDATDGTQRMFKMFGDGVGTSAEQTAERGKTFSRPSIYFTGSDNLFLINHDTYFFNLPFIQGVNFFQPRGNPAWKKASLIKIVKGNAITYPRNAKIIDCNFSGWRNIWSVVRETGTASDGAAYIGPTSFIRCHLRQCRGFVYLDAVGQNRFFVDKCYIHPGSGSDGESAFKLKHDGWVYLSLRDTTLEGCNPAVFDMSESALESSLILDNVASEYSGNRPEDGGWGFIKPLRSGTYPCRLSLYITNNAYKFFDMPGEFRLWWGAKVYSQASCDVSGIGVIAGTPETVRPTVSDNEAFGQSELYTTVQVLDGYFRQDGLDKLADGEIGDTYSPSMGRNWSANALPSSMRGKTTGINSHILRVDSGEYTAPSSGLFFLPFTSKTTGNGRLGSLSAQRTIKIDKGGTGFVDIGVNNLAFSGHVGVSRNCLVMRAEEGDKIDSAHLEFTSSEFEWSSFVDLLFYNRAAPSDICCGASEAKTSKVITIPAGESEVITGPKTEGEYSVRARLFSGRSYAEYIVSGKVAAYVIPSRTVTTLASNLESNITVTPVGGGNNGFSINLQVQNDTSSAKSFRLDCEFLS